MRLCDERGMGVRHSAWASYEITGLRAGEDSALLPLDRHTYAPIPMTINYQELEDEARADLADPVYRALGLIQVWSMFMTSHEVGKELKDRLDEMSVWSKHALTATMVVEYSKPWGRNLEPLLVDLDLSYLSPVKTQPLHSVLLGYRHNAAAHLGRGVQPGGAVLIGAVAVNERPTDTSFEKLFIPGKLRVDFKAARGLTDAGEIATIVDHIGEAMALTERETRIATASVRETALKYPAVLDRLSGVVDWGAIQPDDAGDIRIPRITDGRGAINSASSSVRTIDGRKFVEMILRWESMPPAEFNVAGNGFRITSTPGSASDRAGYRAVFDEYASADEAAHD